MEQQSPENTGFREEGDGFDAVAFVRQIFNTINSNRSNVGPIRNQLIDTPVKSGKTGKYAENPINAFYRLIGLPAIRNEALITDDPINDDNCDKTRRDNALSQGGTLNYFTDVGLQTTSEGVSSFDKIEARDIILNKDKTPEKFNEMIKNPLPINASIDQAETLGRRPTLFPMLVDASVPVYPIKRRVAPLFFDGDYILLGGQTRVKRPFLQHVIYMRTKVFSGVNTEVKNNLRTNIIKEVNNEELLPQSALNDFKFLELKIIQRLVQALKQSAKAYIRTRDLLKELGADVKYVPAPVDEPRQRSGAAQAADPSVDLEISTNLDGQIQALNARLNDIDLFMLSLPTEQVNRSDKIRRIEDQISIGNISPDAFIGEFNSLLSYDRAPIEQEKSRVVAERKRVIQKTEKAREAIQYYTGEFTGLSIFDIISVFYGLFTVDRESLVALLNQSAQERLLNDPFFVASQQATANISTAANIQNVIDVNNLPTPRVALTNLQNKVKEAFDIAVSFQERTARTSEAPPQPVE